MEVTTETALVKLGQPADVTQTTTFSTDCEKRFIEALVGLQTW